MDSTKQKDEASKYPMDKFQSFLLELLYSFLLELVFLLCERMVPLGKGILPPREHFNFLSYLEMYIIRQRETKNSIFH
jgi:hypothetical protein